MKITAGTTGAGILLGSWLSDRGREARDIGTTEYGKCTVNDDACHAEIERYGSRRDREVWVTQR